MDEQRRAFQRLERAAVDGRLQSLCDRYGVDLLVGFGSAVRDTGRPAADVDLAFRFDPARRGDLVGFVDAVTALLRIDAVDFMDLERAAPVAREQALLHGKPLFERRSGDFARAQMSAINQRMDTEWIRQMQRKQLTEWQ